MADRPVGSAKIVLSLDPTNLEKQLVTINHKLVDGMASIDAAYKAVGTKSGPAFEAMKANATAAMNTITAKGLASGEELVRIQQETAAKIAAITSQQYKAQEAAMAKANTANMEYQLAKRQYEQETLRQSIKAQEAEAAARTSAIEKANRANMEYQLAKRKYEKETASKSASDAAAPGKLLGFTSVAEFNKQRDAIISAYDTIGKSVEKGTRDHINLERAKNEKLKALNAEMVGSHEMSMASMMRAVLRLYAVYYVLSTAARVVISPFEKGFKAVEDFNTAVAESAAMVMSFSERQAGMTIESQWGNALSYAKELVPVLEDIAARTLLSGQETIALSNAFQRQGVFLNANNKDQVESFSRIANALPLMTRGSEIMRQINTEIRSLMNGTNASTSALLTSLREMDPEIDSHLKMWREENSVLENIGNLLVGFGYATSILENQWQAVKSTLDTTVTQILRGGMESAYQDIIQSVKDLNGYLEENKTSLTEGLSDWITEFRIAVISVEAEIMRLAMLLDKIGGTMTSGQMLLYGPGSALGVESSTKRFEAAAEANMMYEKRYKETDAALEKLATKQIQLEERLTSAYKEREKAEKGSGPTPKGKYTNFDDAKEIQEIIDKLKEKAMVLTEGEAALLKNKLEALNASPAQIAFAESLQKTIEGANGQKKALRESEAEIERQAKAIEDYIKKITEEYETLGMSNRALEERKAIQAGLSGDQVRATMAIYDETAAWKATMKASQDASDAIEADDKKRVESIEGIIASLREEAKQLHMTAREKVAYNITSAGGGNSDVERALKEFDKITEAKAQVTSFNDEIDKLKDRMGDLGNIGKSFGDSMASGINNAVIAFKDLTKALDASNAANELKNKLESGGKFDLDPTKDLEMRKKAMEDLNKFEENNTENQIAAYRQLFGTTSQLFKENSKERKAMHAIEQVLAGIEIAMELKKVAISVAGYMTKSTAAVTAGTIQQTEAAATATTEAAAAVAAQGSIPIAGFAMAAAMAALMAGVLSQAGISFSGGGSGSAPAATPTATNYSGTVLGDITASSESITNVTDMLMDIYADEYPELQRIRQEMIELNNNITGLVSSIVRNGGTFAGGITTIESPLKASIDNMANSMNQMLWSFDKYLAGFGTSFTIGPQLLIKAVGWVAEKLWGGGSKTWVTGSGIDLKDATLGGLSAGSGIGTRTYLDTRTKHDGGLFGDTHWSSLTQYGEVDEQTKALFDKVFVGMSESINQLGEAFGTNQQKIDNYKISIGKINLADKTGEEINKIITDTLSTAFDNAVASIFDISSYQKVGEGLYETAVRLVVDKEVILSSLDMIGMAFTGVANSMEAVDFAETLLGFSEDLETFTADVSKYFTTFFTEQEQFEWSTSQLRKALENINAELPLTRAGFKDLVSGLNLSTDAGKQAFVMLMGLTSAADDYYSALEKIIENAQDLSNKIYGELYSRELPTFEYENWQLAVQMAETLKSIAELGPEYAYLADQANRLFTLQKQEISDKTNKEVIALDEALSLEKPIDQWQTQIEEANDKAFDFLERIASLPAESAERLKGAIELWREDAIDEIVSKRDAENLNSTLNFLTFQRTINGVSSTDETIARIANRREWGDSYGGVGNFDMQRLYDEQLRPFLTMSFDDLRSSAELMGMTWEDLASDTTALSEVFNSLRDEAKSAANTFDSLSQSIRDQIRGMETSLTNPADTLERLGIQKNAISEYLGGNSASGFIASLQDDSEKSSAITKLQGMYSEELELYKELYQRPSEGYQAGYREILTNLEELLGVSESLKTDYDLQYEQTDYLRQIAENTKNGAGSKKTDEDTVAPTSINVALDPSGHYTANDIVGLLQQLLPKILPGLIRQTGSIRTEVQNAGAGR